ncbi:MAG: DUF692 family protein [Myxococcales bacterium]|nr:DUF692 family protein [Myxococcales bacterium]
MTIRCGLSLLPAEDVRLATAPLFEAGAVDAVEWNVDFGFPPATTPVWIESILARFEEAGALYAHGVELSPMSAELAEHQRAWLESLGGAFRERRYRHLTEHYGFITAGEFVRGTPLPLPPSRALLSIATERIERLQELTGSPVGIENLAFAFGREDAVLQAEVVRELCERTGAFVLLDVHNLLCQIENFDLDALALAELYGLHRVREVHIAGGSLAHTAAPPLRPFRRDSHDHDVPDPAFALLAQVVPRCPALEVVILERSDRSTFTVCEGARHRADFLRVREVVSSARAAPQHAEEPRSAPLDSGLALATDTPEQLARYQSTLLVKLNAGQRPAEAVIAELAADAELAAYSPYVATFEPRAVEIATAMAAEWCARDDEDGTIEAAVLRSPRAPLAVFRLPIPEPGPGQVLVRPMAVGLCGTDVHAYDGAFPLPLPIVLGHEIAGVVVELGPGTTGLRVGDSVGISWIQRTCGACPACARGQETRCAAPRTWIENGGGLSELLVAEATGCTKLPSGLDLELAAPLFCAGHVATSALLRARPAAGERVAILGLGGLGHLAVQIAAALGHEVVAITSTEEKRRDALALGAHESVLGGDDPGAALADAGGADIVLAMTSSMRHAASAVHGVRDGGRLVVVGLGQEPLAIDPIELVQREASIIGAVQGPRSELDAVLDLAARGRVRPRVEAFPWHLANRALGRLAEGRVRYRAVIV